MKTKFSRPSEEYKKTTNRAVFNKLHKFMLEKHREIHCAYCSYHRGENDERKYYGEVRSWMRNKESTFRYPNWKLASKKKKQWMNGTFRKVVKHSNYFPDYLKFEF